MKRLGSVLVLALMAAPASAMPLSLTDTTLAGATVDGSLGVGEYGAVYGGINSGFGNVIGSNGQLLVESNSSGGIQMAINRGGGNFNDAAAIYIDSVAGGLSDTQLILDNSSRTRAPIAGRGEFLDPGNISNMAFAPGFGADYAIGVSYNFFVAAELFKIEPSGALTFVANLGLTGDGSIDPGDQVTEFSFNLSDIGLSPGDSFDFFATYLNPGNAYRSDEFIGVAQASANSGNIGNGGNDASNTFSLQAGDFNTFTSVVPEPSTVALAGAALIGLAFARRKRG